MTRSTPRLLLEPLAANPVVIALVVSVSLSAALVPSFFSSRTLGLTLDQASTVGITAVGMTLLLIAGQVDLSAGSTLALTGIVAIALQGEIGALPAAVLGIVVGLAVGVLNALLVVRFGIVALIATLATMLMVRGTAYLVSGSKPVAGIDVGFGLGVSAPIAGVFTPRSLVFLLAIVALQILLTRTVPGRNLFAFGSNPIAAQGSGIRTSRYVIGAFIFAGGMTGLAGVLQSLAINTGSPIFNETTTLSVIAAVVVGGTRLEGGRGSALGTLGGVLVIASIQTALTFQNVPSYLQEIVIGALLVAMVVLDRLTTDRGSLQHTVRRLLLKRSETGIVNGPG